MRIYLRARAGFTLIELLVVIAIIGTLLGLLLPAVQSARESAAATQCKNNLKQLGLATQTAHDTVGYLPPAIGNYPASDTSWQTAPPTVFLLPYIEQQALFEQIRNQGGVNPGGTGAIDFNGNAHYVPPTFNCPSDATRSQAASISGSTDASFGNYAVNGQVFGTVMTKVKNGVPTCSNFSWVGYKRIPGHFPDGVSNTIFWTEKASVCTGTTATADGGTRWAARGKGAWMATIGDTEGTAHLSPNILPQLNVGSPSACDWFQPSSSHPAGLTVALGDGSVRSVSQGVSQLTFNLAMVPDDGQELGPDW
jgi:prepilin-type N-terminal cleavage/methylation domain-containing protein